MLSTKLKEAAGNSADATLYVDDVFSTYLYTGNGSTQTITNGIDLAGKGGLVWIKSRTIAGNSHFLTDTERGVNKVIYSNLTNAQVTKTVALTNFNSDGFTLGSEGGMNGSSDVLASWTFRKAAKFFDVVTYTGTGSAQTIAHSLGVAPGMIIIKRTDTVSDWVVYHIANYSAYYNNVLYLNKTDATIGGSNAWNSTPATASQFYVGAGGAYGNNSASGSTYVAYLFATPAGISKVGSYTGNGTGQAIACGFSAGARFVLIKRTDSTGDWYTFDSARGLTSGSSPYLLLNSTAAEVTGNNGVYASTGGFTLATSAAGLNASGGTYIFLAVA